MRRMTSARSQVFEAKRQTIYKSEKNLNCFPSYFLRHINMSEKIGCIIVQMPA